MTIKTFLKSAVLGAGAVILVAGMALAQTPAPAPAPTAPQATTPAQPGGMDKHEMRSNMRRDCREKTRDMKGSDRRDAMQKCMSEARAASGMPSKSERKAHLKELRDSCRAELKDQRFTEDERKKAMRDCAVKKDPSLGKAFACRDEAEAKKLEQGSKDYRAFMKTCNTRG